MALPNLKSKIFDFTLPRPRPPTIPPSSKRFDQSLSLPYNFETPEHPNTFLTPRHHKSKSLNQAVSKELIKLEQDLDYNEMITQKSGPLEQFQVYKGFFDSLAQTIKFKNEKISKLVFRGVLGFERLVHKLAEIPQVQVKYIEKIVKAKVETEDFQCQFDVEKWGKSMKAEYDNIKQLPGVVDKIQISRISNQLEDLMENLNNMRTEIPSPTSSPEMIPLEEFDNKRNINLKLTVMRENITKILKNPENIVKRLGIDKSIQTNIDVNSSLLSALESMNSDKELANFKLRSINNMNLNEKSKLEDSLIKSNNLRNALENRNSEYESELSKLRREKFGLEEENQELRAKVQKLEESLQKVINDLKNCKKNCKNLKNLLLKKQKYLQDTLDQLYNTQVMWKVAEKKLKDIEKAYLAKTGEVHKYKDINIFDISQKLGIRKIQLQSIEAEVSQNKEVDQDEEYVPLVVEDEPGSVSDQKKLSFMKIREESENFLALNGQQDYSSYVKSRKVSRNASNVGEESEESQEAEEYKKGIDRKPPVYKRKVKKRPENQKTEAVIEKKSENLDSGKKESIKKPQVDALIEESQGQTRLRAEIRPADTIKLSEKRKVLESDERKDVYPEKLEKTEPRLDKKLENPKKSEKIEPKLSSDKGQISINQDVKKEKLSSNLPEPPQKPKNFLHKPAKEEIAKQKIAKINTMEKNQLPLPQTSVNPSLSTSISNSNSNLSDLQAVNKHFLPELPETNSEVSKNSPDPQNYSEATQKSSFSQQVIKKSVETTNFVMNNFKAKVSVSEYTQSHQPEKNERRLDVMSFNNKSEIPTYVPAKFEGGKKGDEAKAQVKVVVNKKEYSNKIEQSTYDQDTQSRSFETEKMNSHYCQSELSWAAGLSEDQQKSLQIIQENIIEKKIFNLQNCSKSIQCLLLDDNSAFNNEKFSKAKEKYKDVLNKVFGNVDEIDLLPNYAKIRIKKGLKGHNNQCAEICVHLKRVMQVKRKIKGVPYPIKIVKL